MDSQNKKKKKFDFKVKKDRAIKSIAEVNCFLSKLNTAYTLKKIIKQ